MESPRDIEEDAGLPDRLPAPLALAGVVLCGGRSLRMGVDKATLNVGGATLLQRAVDRLSRACDPVLVAPGGLHVEAGGHAIVEDALPGAGPLGALVGALRRTPHRLLGVVAVDMPWLDPTLLMLLAGRIGGNDAAVCATGRGIEPLHAVYAISALEATEAALQSSDRSLHALLGRIQVVTVTETEWRAAGISDRFARNVNTVSDLERLRRELHPAAS